jgi:molybdate transport system substrate-binding protein
MWSCRVIRRVLAAAAILVVAACGSPGGQSAGSAPQRLVVFAAASLQPAFDKMARNVHLSITFNYAGTQTLTGQLTQGAQADVFASADMTHMKTVQDAGFVAGEPKLFAHNRLEIAVEKGNPKGIHSLADLARPGVVVILADPSVPAGKYAQQALAKAGVTVHPKSLEPQVTGVLSKVALGEADAGIVYISDVTTSGKVDGVAIPDSQNVVADYPIAKIRNAPDPSAADTFVTYVLSPPGQAILLQAGFEKA